MNKKEFIKSLANPPYEMITLDTSVLIIPRDTYQRPLQSDEVKEIIAQFNIHLLNEPKVSFRNGKYYVFDGQHTIISLLEMNEGEHFPIRCKVYFGMTELEEAKLFSMQTGAGRKLTPGDRIRAELYAKDTAAMNFRDATLKAGVSFEHSGASNSCSLRCINTARAEYERVGEKIYTEALDIMVEAWTGICSTFKADVLKAVVAFVNEYSGKYSRERLITRLKAEDPEMIYRTIRSDFDTPVELRYINPIVKIYNGNSTLNALGNRK